ncbi:MAG: glutathione S-transferase N-terminal domain-containing protein [Rhodospirillales bacterium]|nr:glutathione S-transferase N-terminal domain-containing protein [Rhodospirillales bacterium]
MKLHYSPTSPYVRKVTVTAIETGLIDRIERIWTPAPSASQELPGDNPLGKVPTLILDTGERLFDSPVIVEYLDSQHQGAKLVPPSGDPRWKALRLQALADGILDAAVLRLLETRRPANEQSKAWIEKQKTVVGRSLDWLEKHAGSLDQTPTIGNITVAIACDYLDFRFPSDDWRASRPMLTAWHKRFAARRSMQESYPKDPS